MELLPGAEVWSFDGLEAIQDGGCTLDGLGIGEGFGKAFEGFLENFIPDPLPAFLQDRLRHLVLHFIEEEEVLEF